MTVDWPAARAGISKKASFEATVGQLFAFCEQQRAAQQLLGAGDERELLALLRRMATLLKTRYSSPVFWRCGAALLTAAQVGRWGVGGTCGWA